MCATSAVIVLIVRPGLLHWIHGCGEETRRLGVVGDPGWRRDDEEFGGDEVEFARQREEAGVERRFCFCLFEDFAVVEVGVGEDAPEAAGE
jgi:hypothetical protein